MAEDNCTRRGKKWKCFARPLGLLAVVTLLSGCVTDFNVSMRDQPGYRDFIGKTYVLKQDLYLTRLNQGGGLNLERFYPNVEWTDRTLPAEVDSKNVGLKLLNGSIVDFIPIGSQIHVTDVIVTRVEFEHWTWLMCDVVVDGATKWSNVSTIFIQDSPSADHQRVPTLRPESVEEENARGVSY